MTAPDSLPADLAEAHAMILAERTARLAAEAEATRAKEAQRALDLEIERLAGDRALTPASLRHLVRTQRAA